MSLVTLKHKHINNKKSINMYNNDIQKKKTMHGRVFPLIRIFYNTLTTSFQLRKIFFSISLPIQLPPCACIKY